MKAKKPKETRHHNRNILIFKNKSTSLFTITPSRPVSPRAIDGKQDIRTQDFHN